MGEQDLQDPVLLIYLRSALPKEYGWLLTGVQDMANAWERLEGRFGDSQQRVLAIYNKLSMVELRGKEFEKIESLHFEVQHAEALMTSAGTNLSFSHDMHLVPNLLSKLSPASVDRWNDYAEEQPFSVVRGVNEWTTFKAWLEKGYSLAKRSRLSAGLPHRSTQQYVPVKPAPAKPICNKCRKVGHKPADCPEDFEVFTVDQEEDIDNRGLVHLTAAERESRRKDTEKRFGKCKLCGLNHTYKRPVGSDTVDWPSERLSGCPTFMAMTPKQRAELIEARKFCP